MTAVKEIRKIIIIGGGPAGILAALQLKKANGITPVVYEIRRQPTTLGGAIGIPSNGLRLLDRLGLYNDVAARGALTPKLVLYALKGCVMGEMDLSSWSEQQTGFGYLRIQRTDLMDVLLGAAKQADIQIHYGKAVEKIEDEGHTVTARFVDGTADTADFLLGCDGIHSAVRKLYIDPGSVPEYSGFANMFALVRPDEVCPRATSIDTMSATLTSDGLFVIAPTTPTRDLLYWFFSREVALPAFGNVRDGWEERGKEAAETFKATLLDLLGSQKSDWMDMVHEIINNTNAVQFYPIYKMPRGRPWSRGRCMVLGDAAHAMPPHASQGVSMALEDVFLFSKMLKSNADSLEDAMQVWEKKRKVRTEAMLDKAESNGSLRKSTASWRLRAMELAISGGLWVSKTTGIDKMGFGQKPLAYDVEEEHF